MEHLAVIGAGAMGRGIIETAATHGVSVRAVEIDEAACQRASAAIRTSLEKAIKRGKLTAASPDEFLAKIEWKTDLSAAASDADFVIEAMPENEELKVSTFERLDRICKPGVVIASNTSSISITKLAAATKRSDRVVGMHFFNPVPVMAPVEIVRGEQTSAETVEETRRLAETMGKQAFVVTDGPGFAVNRILMPLINEAVFALQEGVADAATIDSLMKLGCNHPMGPLELADFVGLDICLSILEVLHRDLGDPKFRPCPLLVRKVNAKQLGRKTGRGFYEYPAK